MVAASSRCIVQLMPVVRTLGADVKHLKAGHQLPFYTSVFNVIDQAPYSAISNSPIRKLLKGRLGYNGSDNENCQLPKTHIAKLLLINIRFIIELIVGWF